MTQALSSLTDLDVPTKGVCEEKEEEEKREEEDKRRRIKRKYKKKNIDRNQDQLWYIVYL